MGKTLPISEDQRDCLQEVCNVALGAGGEALAQFANVFVQLPVPYIRYLQPESITEALASLRGDAPLSGVMQVYQLDGHSCYALTVLTEDSIIDLAALAGLSCADDKDTTALLYRLSDTLTDVCLPILATQLGFDQHGVTGPPSLIALHQPFDQFFPSEFQSTSAVLTAEMNYHLEGHPFNCDLVLAFPDASCKALCASLDRLLDF